MSKEIKLNKELIQKAKEVKSAEELKALAKENGVELSDEQAADMFSKLNTSGELADDELDAVVGGACWKNGVSGLYCQCGGGIDGYFDYFSNVAEYYKCKKCGKEYETKDDVLAGITR